MIDIHSHILPNVDDGADSIEESLEMAKLAIKEGIHTVLATPHHRNGMYENEKSSIIETVNQVNSRLKAERIPLTVLPGQEVRVYGEILEDLQSGSIQTLNDSTYLLIEFPSNHIPRYANQLFFELQQRGIQPILVHPERNAAIMENPNILYDFVQKGVHAQVTAGCVVGKFGKKIKKLTNQLIAANLIHFVASDAHNTTTRQFWMQEAFEEIESQYGYDQIYYFQENAQLIVSGQNVMREMPQPVKQRKFLGLF